MRVSSSRNGTADQDHVHARTDAAPSRGFWATVWAILRHRCPRCRQGQVFRGILTMNDPCPVCGLLFQREAGYFLGAMYFSYGIGAVLLTTFYFTVAALLPSWHSAQLLALVIGLYIPLMPAVFRYARVLWIYFDRSSDTYSHLLLSTYEKMRLRELQGPKDDLSASNSDPHGS